MVVFEPDATFLAHDIYKMLAYADDFEVVYGSRTVKELIWQGANMGLFLKWGNYAVAKLMEVSPASITAMVKKLARRNLVTYRPYHGVKLTEPGHKIALEVIRHHRLVELYLKEALGVPWDQVHKEADKWEHVLSEDLENRIDTILGHPHFDPHGAPIPSTAGELSTTPKMTLLELAPGNSSTVVEVNDHDPEMLRHLSGLGIGLNTEVTVEQIEPFDGPLTLNVANRQHSISRLVARNIFVADNSAA